MKQTYSNKQISPFSTLFPTQSDKCVPICPYFDISLFVAESKKPKIGISDKGLSPISKMFSTASLLASLKLGTTVW